MTTTRVTPPRMTPRSATGAAVPNLHPPAGADSGAANVQSAPKARARRRTIRPASPKSIDEVLAGIGPRDANRLAAPKPQPRRDTTDGRRARIPSTPKESPPAGSDSRAATTNPASKNGARRGTTPHPTIDDPTSKEAASDGRTTSPRARAGTKPKHISPTGGTTSRRTIGRATPREGPSVGTAGRQRNRDTQSQAAAGRHLSSDTQAPPVAEPGPVASASTLPMENSLLDPTLALAADVLDDIERVRIANENRLRQLTRSEDDVDGELRGFGLTEDHPAVARLAAIVNTLVQVEKDATKALEKTIQEHPLHPWIKAQRGVGDKQAARLLAAIGDPYIRPELHCKDGTVKPEGPRTVSALWAYSGYHTVPVAVDHTSPDAQTRSVDQVHSDTQERLVGGNSTVAAQMAVVWVAAKRARGQKANWSATAKMRAHLVAEKVVQLGFRPKDADEDWQPPVYRRVYDDRRMVTETRVHAVACVRCGPSGKPAPVGSPWSKGHQHADGLRIVAKEILKDLWREGKRLHEQVDGDQILNDTQQIFVAADPNTPVDQGLSDTQRVRVDEPAGGDQGARNTHSVTVAARPNPATSIPTGQVRIDAHTESVGGELVVADQVMHDTQTPLVAADIDVPTDHAVVDTQMVCVGGDSGGSHRNSEPQRGRATADPNVPVDQSVTESQSRRDDGDRVAPDQVVHDAHAGLVGGSP